MRLIRVENISGKEVLGNAVIDSNGRVLLTSGMKLQRSYINKLIEMGVSAVYIEDELSEGIVPEDVVLNETRMETKRVISTESKRLMKNKEINIAEIYKVVDLIINDILRCKDNLINVKDIRLKDEQLFAHSVNSAIMAALICKKLEYNYEKTANTVTGVLLHDIGKLFIPKEIVSKQPHDLNLEEYEIYKSHPKIGYELLKDRVDIKPTVRVTILMHHERIDGYGFPEGYKNNKIHESAKICSICSSFDNVANASGKIGVLSTTEAYEFIRSFEGSFFDKEISELFLKHVPVYPVGTIVILNEGYVGIVTKNNSSNFLRPILRVFYNAKSKEKINPFEIDLMKELSISIDKEVITNIVQEIEDLL